MLCWILIAGGLPIMMGQHDRSEALFYYFRLEDQVPETHLLRLSYRSALFMMNRIRFAMAPALDAPKLTGTVELDEVYIGPRKPRYKGVSGPGRSTLKTPVFCAVERGGQLRRRVVADVTAATLRQAILEDVDSRAHLMTDEYSTYRWLKKGWTGTHETVCHRTFEYARADVHVNTAESSHALIRRGLIGIYHNVSREYLHRYLWQFDFLGTIAS